MGRTARATSVVMMAIAAGVSVPTAVSARETIVYLTRFDDADESASEWGFPAGETTVTEHGYTAEFTPGALTVTLDGAANVWLNPDVDDLPADQAVETRVDSSTGDESALFGVACRAKLHASGYVFLVGTDGYYTIGRYDDRGKARAIVNGDGSKRTDAVEPDDANVVTGECTGKKHVKLTLLVNGTEVASIVDRKPPKGLGRNAFVVTEVEAGAHTETVFGGLAVRSL